MAERYAAVVQRPFQLTDEAVSIIDKGIPEVLRNLFRCAC